MIKINRAQCPNILQNPPRAKSSYNNPSVTSALETMQFTKCAYCETRIVIGAQVDHYIPREEFVTGTDTNGNKIYDWDAANEWENLIYSCSKCNGTKKTPPFLNGTRVIINPTLPNSNPENFLDFRVLGEGSLNIVVVIIPKNKSPLGKSTIEILNLDTRIDHLRPLRQLAIKLESLFLSLIVNIKDGIDINDQDNQNKLSEIYNSMLSNHPYAGFTRAFFNRRMEEFKQHEKPDIEKKLNSSVNLNITIPKGVVV